MVGGGGGGVVPARKKLIEPLTHSRHYKLTLISIGTLLFPCGTGLAVKLAVAFLVEDAVIVGLLKGEPLAVLHLIALQNAFLKRGDGKRVNKVSLALECAMTFSGRTSEAKYRLNLMLTL